MTDREKLIELLKSDPCPSPLMCEGKSCKYHTEKDCFVERFADYLLSHGVVVREKGEWIPLKDMVKGDTIYHCSKCWTKTGKRRRKRYNFCPSCGADMRGEQHDD